MDIKKIVQQTIAETAGVQMSVKRLSELMADAIIDRMVTATKNDPRMLNGEYWNIPLRYDVPVSIFGDTWIRTVDLMIDFCNSSGKEPTGSFKSGKTKKHDGTEPSFSVHIELVIHVPIEELKNKRTIIRSILAHELNHAFVFIHDVNKKTATLNAKNNRVKATYSEDPGVQLFSRALYLSNPMEIQARIQDIGGLVDDLQSNTAEDALLELMLYQPFKELSELNNMDFRKVKHTEAVQNFVNQMGGHDITSFISDLNQRRKTAAYDALKKVYRLVSDRYKVNEEFWIDADAFSIIHESDWPPRSVM